MPMQEYGAYQAPAKKKVIKKRPEDMGRGKKVAVAKKTAPAKMTPSYRQEDMGRGKLGGGAAGRGKGGEAAGRNKSSSA